MCPYIRGSRCCTTLGLFKYLLRSNATVAMEGTAIMNCIPKEFWEIKAPKLNGSVKNLLSRGTPNIFTVMSSMNSIT